MKRWTALLVVGLVLPTAAAASVSGVLVARGPVTLPAGVTLDLSAPAAFWTLDDASLLTGRADALVVERTTTESYGTPVVRVRASEAVATYALTNVSVAMEGPAGWLGSYADAGLGAVTFVAERSVVLLPSQGAHVGNAERSSSGSDEGSGLFFDDLEGPAFAGEVTGLARIAGDGVLKIKGSTLVLTADENVTTERTGVKRGAGDAHEEESWLVVQFTNASFELRAREPAQVAGRVAQATGSGSFAVARAEGRIASRGSVYDAQGVSSRLAGELALGMAAAASDGAPVLRIAVEGDLSATSLAAARVPLVSRAPVLLAAGVAGLALLGVGIAVAAARHRREVRTLSVDECLDLAHAAADEERFEDALAWNRRAQARAPESARLRVDEGWYLYRAGRVDESLAALAAGGDAGAGGEAEFLSALVLLQTGQDPAKAEEYLLRALQKDPLLAHEIETDDTFLAVRGMPRLRQALRRTR